MQLHPCQPCSCPPVNPAVALWAELYCMVSSCVAVSGRGAAPFAAQLLVHKQKASETVAAELHSQHSINSRAHYYGQTCHMPMSITCNTDVVLFVWNHHIVLDTKSSLCARGTSLHVGHNCMFSSICFHHRQRQLSSCCDIVPWRAAHIGNHRWQDHHLHPGHHPEQLQEQWHPEACQIKQRQSALGGAGPTWGRCPGY